MNVYITRINGLSLWNPSQYRQHMTAMIAHQLGCKEMGIYRYPAENESAESLSARLDGIIAGINAGDIVICQFPTGNGLKFDRELVNRLKAYRGRAAIFIHETDILFRKENHFMLHDTIDLYNQAEVLIVPSYAMKQFLIEHGIRKGMKFVIQEMWDYTVSTPFPSTPEFRKEIHYTGDSGFEGIRNWNYSVPLIQHKDPDSSFGDLQKGGFGLVWYRDKEYLQYGAPFSLGRYLAAGIPIIVPAGISNQALIEANHLGLVINSLNEAAAAVEAVNESEYRSYVQKIEDFAPALRAGYYTKRCLIDAIQAFYRKDAGKISIPPTSYSLGACQFTYAVTKTSYNDNLALSWKYQGDADGFLICDTAGAVIHDTGNIHQHYYLIKGCKTEEQFVIKAYVDTLRGKLIVAETNALYQNIEQLKEPKVSIIIPAYNSEGYIARSIDTALAQSFNDLEIVVVNDGSIDHTPEIIDWYAEKYPNVIALHQENGGVGAARNTGIKHAQGKYIAFLDCDDMFYPNMIERLYCSAKKNDCDIAIVPYYYMSHTDYYISPFSQYPVKEDAAVNVNEFFDMHSIMAYQTPSVWNKLYRTALVKKVAFPSIPYEDEAWLPCIISFAKQICYIGEGLYEYDRTISTDTLYIRTRNNSSDTIFEYHKKAILFYLENGNRMRLDKLKNLAQKELTLFAKIHNNVKYKKLWEEIDKTF